MPPDFFDFLERAFARQHHEVAAQFAANSTPAALVTVICVEA